MDNAQTTALPNRMFARAIEIATLERQLQHDQNQKENILKEWEGKHSLVQKGDGWWKGNAFVVVQPKEIARDLLERYHDTPTAGHPGIAKTTQQLVKDYWWPEVRKFV